MSKKVLCLALGLLACGLVFCPGLILAAEPVVEHVVKVDQMPTFDFTTVATVLLGNIGKTIAAGVGIGLSVWGAIYLIRVFRRSAG